MCQKKMQTLDKAVAFLQEGSRLCANGDPAQGLALMDSGSALLRELDPDGYAALDSKLTEYHAKMQQLDAKMDAIAVEDKAQLRACLKEANQLTADLLDEKRIE